MHVHKAHPDWRDASSISLHAKILQALRRLDDRLLARYRWLVDCIDQIRCEGSCPDAAPSRPLLPIDGDLRMSMQALQFDIDSLEHHWETTRQCASPLSGRSLAEQIDALLDLAETYIARAEALRRHCWRELSRIEPPDIAPRPWRVRKQLGDTRLYAQHIALTCTLLPLGQDAAAHRDTREDEALDSKEQQHLGRCLGQVLRPTDFVYRMHGNAWFIVLTRIQPESIGSILRRLVSTAASNPPAGSQGEITAFKLTFTQEKTVAGEHLANVLLRNGGALIHHEGIRNGVRRWRCLP